MRAILCSTILYLVAVAAPSQGLAQVGTVIVPSSHESTEGGDSFADNPAPVQGLRVQELYLADEFSSLPDGRGVLVGLAYRPDRRVISRRVAIARGTEFRLSTTDAQPGPALSWAFADNIGDDETLVYSGSWRVETDGSGPSSGPKDFDYSVDFQKPFIYDSSQGNLLVDWSFGPGSSGTPSFDSDALTPGAYRRLVGFGPSTSSATEAGQDVRIVQFELTWFGDANLDREFNSGDMVQVFVRGKYETGVDASWEDGDWNGDGQFDSGDLIVAFQDGGFEQGPRAAVSAVPEPSGIGLLAMAMLVLLPLRRSTE